MDRDVHSIPSQRYHRRPVRGQPQNRLMRPWEFDLVHDVYSAIIAEPWFSRSATHRSEFAAECMEIYRAGVSDAGQFHGLCERRARERHATARALWAT